MLFTTPLIIIIFKFGAANQRSSDQTRGIEITAIRRNSNFNDFYLSFSAPKISMITSVWKLIGFKINV